MQYCYFLLLLCINAPLFSQDISGYWRGYLMQGGKPFDIEATFWRENEIDYHSFFAIADYEEYGVFEVTSKFFDGTLQFKDSILLDDYSPAINTWCYKNGNLKYDSTKRSTKLVGKWKGKCLPGTMEIKKIHSINCTSTSKSTDLSIYNGDFEQSYKGFSSDYIISPRSTYGAIRVVEDAQQFSESYVGKGDGCFLAIEGSVVKQKVIWKQNISLKKQIHHAQISFQLSNLNTKQKTCLVRVFADSLEIGKAKCPSKNNIWETHHFSFQSDKKMIAISLENQQVANAGDDFGIDNISLLQFKKTNRTFTFYYDHNTFDLSIDQQDSIKKLVDVLNNHPGSYIELIGFASDIGSTTDNLTLSKNRVKKIEDRLLVLGLNPKRISKDAQGEIQLKKNSTIESQRSQNRRVDIKITNILSLVR